MTDRASPAPLRHESVPLEDVAHRRALRPGPARMLTAEDLQQLLRAPRGMAAPRVEDRIDEFSRCAVRIVRRSSRSIAQTVRPVLQIAIDLILRVDLVKRLSYLENPDVPKWAIRARARFEF